MQKKIFISDFFDLFHLVSFHYNNYYLIEKT